jgi:thiamine-monophosphate kinase
MQKKVSDLGEYALIRRILGYGGKFSAGAKGIRQVVPIGDDALAISLYRCGSACLVATTDVLIEDVHFRTCWARLFDNPGWFFRALGYKSLAVNLSDLAAMGAVKPIFYLIGLGLPVDTPVDIVDNLYAGFKDLAEKNRIFLGGGDTNSSKKWVISVTAIGITVDKPVTRDGAQPCDNIYTTGSLGDSAAGLEILNGARGKIRKNTPEFYFAARHLFPPVRLKEAAAVSRHVTSMIDCSDGLYNSVLQICQASGTGADIYAGRIPYSEQMLKYGKRPLEKALFGGEDYELIFTSPAKPARVRAWRIGKIMGKKSGIRIIENEDSKKEIQVRKAGFQHFHNS